MKISLLRNNGIIKKSLWLIFSLAFTSSFVQAEDDLVDIKDLIGVGIDAIGEITIGTKTSQNLQTVPASVTVFTAKQISSMGIKSVQELLNFVPGFQSIREHRFNQGSTVSARGLSTPQSSYDILFIMDGHRLNDASTGGAMVANRYLSTANIEQIEVIRGPGSALYGTGAFSGVVSIKTKNKPLENKDHQFFLAGGNLDSREFHGQVSKQEEDWGLSIFGRYYDDNGQTYDIPVLSGADSIEKDQEIYAKLRWKNLRVNLRYSEEELSGFLGQTIKEVDKIDQESAHIEYDFHDKDQEDWTLTLRGSFQHTSQGWYYKNGQERNTTQDNEFNLGMDSSYQINKDHRLLAGMEWRYASATSTGGLSDKRDVLGIYIQEQYNVTDHLELTVGVRYDRYSDIGQTINPRFALVYNTDADIGATFKLMYGQAFRAPSIGQMTGIIGNPELKSEEIKTLEFAWLQSFSDDYKLALTYFHSWNENKIDTLFAPDFNTINRRYDNIEGILKTSGIEFEMQAQITDEFSLRSAYTHLLTTEQNPRRVAKHMLSLIAMYQYQDFNINLNGYYHSKMEQETLDGIVKLDDYWLLNANVRYQLTDWLTLVGQGHNLLDENYASSSKLNNRPEGIPNRGRTYSLGVEVAF